MFEENPFLAAFYSNRARYAFQTQLFFLLSRYRHQKSEVPAALLKGPLVSDYIFAKDRLFAEQNLSEDELALYRRIHDSVQPAQVPRPDLVIYLQARPDTLMERIRRRGLEAERRITEPYLQQVADRYTRFFYQYDAAPLFIVDAGQLNPVDRDEDFELLLERLRDMRSYREFFGYAG